jgi:hypothetical protein
MVLLDASGRRLRRAIGFLPEYRIERDPAPGVELADAIASDDIECEEYEACEECEEI